MSRVSVSKAYFMAADNRIENQFIFTCAAVLTNSKFTYSVQCTKRPIFEVCEFQDGRK